MWAESDRCLAIDLTCPQDLANAAVLSQGSSSVSRLIGVERLACKLSPAGGLQAAPTQAALHARKQLRYHGATRKFVAALPAALVFSPLSPTQISYSLVFDFPASF